MPNFGNFRPQGGYDNNSQGRGTFADGYNGRNPRQQRNYQETQKKHSGCQMRDSYTRGNKEVVNAPVIFGWNYRRSAGGLSKFVAVPKKEPKTKNPRWLEFVVTITPPGMAAKITTTGFWDTQKQRLLMPDMDMIANPNTPNGGYWGRNYRTKN